MGSLTLARCEQVCERVRMRSRLIHDDDSVTQSGCLCGNGSVRPVSVAWRGVARGEQPSGEGQTPARTRDAPAARGL